MGFFIAMFVCNLLMPLIMLIGGYCMYKNPPKEINGFVGYRTTMSKKNKDTWTFAHDYCGRLWIKLGLILLFPTILWCRYLLCIRVIYFVAVVSEQSSISTILEFPKTSVPTSSYILMMFCFVALV